MFRKAGFFFCVILVFGVDDGVKQIYEKKVAENASSGLSEGYSKGSTGSSSGGVGGRYEEG